MSQERLLPGFQDAFPLCTTLGEPSTQTKMFLFSEINKNIDFDEKLQLTIKSCTVILLMGRQNAVHHVIIQKQLKQHLVSTSTTVNIFTTNPS